MSPRYDCPACSNPLVRVEAQLFRLECGTCHGIWLDRSGTEAVVRGAISVVDDEGSGGGRDVPKSPYRGAPRLFEGRSCPFCSRALELVTVPELGVPVDVCREHGTWFDVSELQAVVDHYVGKTEDDTLGMLLDRARRPSARARRWHPFW